MVALQILILVPCNDVISIDGTVYALCSRLAVHGSLVANADCAALVRGRVEMLRIQISEQADAINFSLEGSLAGPWVAELEKCWNEATQSPPARSITVKLAGVSFVDDSGTELLCRMRRHGARLLPTGCLMKSIVERIEADVCKPQGEAV